MNGYKIDLYLNKKSSDGSIMEKVHDYKLQLQEHEENRLNILKKSPLCSACEREVRILDRYSGEKFKALMFGSNNYLGATVNNIAIDKAIEVTKEYGVGSGGVPLLTGTNIFQNELESTIANVKGFDDAILFSSGFTANIGAIIGLIRSNNLIIHDRLNHASLIDGSLMSGAKMMRYNHNDPASLEKILAENHENYPGGILVVTDGVFSMDGDIARLPEIIDVVNKYESILLIDDAHATGVIGHKGSGSLSHYNITDRKNIILTGTLSKAIGAVGGFITASQDIVNYLRIFARSNMYSTALPPSVCASSTEIFKMMASTDVVDRLNRNANYMREKLKEKGYDTLNSETAIIPIMVRNEVLLTEISKEFLKRGIIVNYIFPPVVSPGKSRIRVSMMATHTKDDMDYFLTILDEIDRDYKIR
ncbi:8-amino-7-oxononanoate synthase [Porphyromonas macacae]|uniref:8-amino-7-oxononanoate synthase n=1 Tax=Porphyromonas macacae TaxID=28115 RepID=A0A0A2EJ85_9PORP|nr:pyridoxal phosphate-dependent aminotransferase family protein [Porphyromonas macacae]KGN76429.1 8-amino-7-oxononanoate synthase [Porphyromonas macacae]